VSQTLTNGCRLIDLNSTPTKPNFCQQLLKVNDRPLLVGCQAVTHVKSIRNLGILLDAELAMDVHISAVVKGCFYQLRQLRSVQRSLTLDARRAIVTAFIANRLDYCNALLYGVAKTEIQRLQTVMNAATRLVGGLGRYDHVTPVLRDTLHYGYRYGNASSSNWQFLLSTAFVVRARLKRWSICIVTESQFPIDVSAPILLVAITVELCLGCRVIC